MTLRKKYKMYFTLFIFIIIMVIIPTHVSGEVQPITETQEKLDSISEEEQESLKKLFTITQEIEELKRSEERISGEIDNLQTEIKKLDQSIEQEHKNYETNLELMKQVLVSYQRGGPASYLEILLKAKNLTAFLKSMNLIKDISKNSNELLASIEEGRQKLIEEKDTLTAKKEQQQAKQDELQASVDKELQLKEEQETYLASLRDQKKQYEEHLASLKLMWEDLKNLFPKVAGEFTKIISEGYFSLEDLNATFNLFTVKGFLNEDTFNRIIKEHSTLTEMVFHFNTNGVEIDVPEKHLVLNGNFSIRGKSAIVFTAESGSFYNMPLEPSSIGELFKDGPLVIDFEKIAGDTISVDIDLNSIETKDGNLNFSINTGFPF